MGFKQPCFIKKNTPELRKKLENAGHVRYPYSIADWDDDGKDRKYIIIDIMYYTYSTEPIGKPKKKGVDFVDCGDNEELFLAIAALRDDSDYMQWFTDGKRWYQNKQNDIEVISYGAGSPINFHKATVEELIEHFKIK